MRPRHRAELRCLRTLGLTAGAMTLTVATLLAGGAQRTVGAATVAEAGATVRLGVATWRAAAAAPGGTHLGMAYVPDWTTRGGDAVAVLDVINVGGFDLATQWIVVRDDASGSGPSGPVEVAACDGGVWSGDGSACPGTVVPLGDASDGPTETGITLAPGQRLSVCLTARRNVVAGSSLVVDVEVRRTAVRGPVATSG